MRQFSRRQVLRLLAAVAMLPGVGRVRAAGEARNFRIRTITAGVRLGNSDNPAELAKTAAFLQQARGHFESLGYEVQTLRMASQPLHDYLPGWQASNSIDGLLQLDAIAAEHGMMLNLGPINNPGQGSREFVHWVAELIRRSRTISCSLVVATPELGVDELAISTSASIMKAVAHTTTGGEGNFRFAASAFCPPGTPFFPAAWFNDNAFSIGLESADLLQDSFLQSRNTNRAGPGLKTDMENALQDIERGAQILAARDERVYLGIDSSPAPNLDVSIGRAIETLSGVAFGAPGTLRACAAITGVLKSLRIRSCGYSGLMLPVLEDTTLALRAREGRYRVSDLLLYSSVCGTGLDVVPLPGDIDEARLGGLVGDVAALAAKYRKPLSARLFPVPGKRVGEVVSFDNPYLTDAVVMDAG